TKIMGSCWSGWVGKQGASALSAQDALIEQIIRGQDVLRQLALKYHPDRNKEPGAEVVFARVGVGHPCQVNGAARAQSPKWNLRFRQRPKRIRRALLQA